ncbi:MAG: hypothetical protein A2V86_03400 [Deltaproteobacteria bacterium RBG_16_49_23]|nr:MAG: hypothetical protein A2V86_03400 [Deltaproteobacteria bacterium RBG_16_49_23]
MKKTFKKVLVILVPIIVMAFFEICAFGQEWTAVQKEIWELEEARWKALTQRDLEGFVKYHHEDGAFWPYWSEEPLNLAKFKEFLSPIEFYSAELKPISIKVFGNVAIVQYTCKYSTMGGNVYSRFTEVRMKQNGVWQVIGKMLHKIN